MRTFEEFQLFDPILCASIRAMAEHERGHQATIVGETRNESNESVRRATRYKIADQNILNKVLDAFGEWDNWDFCTHLLRTEAVNDRTAGWNYGIRGRQRPATRWPRTTHYLSQAGNRLRVAFVDPT